METYEDIFYLHCPHFTVGHVDQWGEQGYLLHEGKVYAYEEDRKNQCGRTYSQMSIEEFLAYAADQKLIVPTDFREQLKGIFR